MALLRASTRGELGTRQVRRLGEAPIDEVVVTDTIPVAPETVEAVGKLVVLSIAELIGEAIHRIHNDESVSSLFPKDVGR